MNRTKVTVVLLGVALVASNAWWAYQAVDAGVTRTHMGVSFEDSDQALTQTLKLLPLVARPGISRAEILAAARLPGTQDEPFEKDGFVWVGKIGLKFSEQGQLIEVVRAWSPP